MPLDIQVVAYPAHRAQPCKSHGRRQVNACHRAAGRTAISPALTSGTRCCSGQTPGRWAPAAAAAWRAAPRPSAAAAWEPAPAWPCVQPASNRATRITLPLGMRCRLQELHTLRRQESSCLMRTRHLTARSAARRACGGQKRRWASQSAAAAPGPASRDPARCAPSHTVADVRNVNNRCCYFCLSAAARGSAAGTAPTSNDTEQELA